MLFLPENLQNEYCRKYQFKMSVQSYSVLKKLIMIRLIIKIRVNSMQEAVYRVAKNINKSAQNSNIDIQKVKIVIIGAGFGGLACAIRLLQNNIRDFIILEKADDVGGTWRENQYPGNLSESFVSSSFVITSMMSRPAAFSLSSS